MADRARRTGKQVLFDEQHFADGANEDAAQAIVDCINNIGLPKGQIQRETHQRLTKFFE